MSEAHVSTEPATSPFTSETLHALRAALRGLDADAILGELADDVRVYLSVDTSRRQQSSKKNGRRATPQGKRQLDKAFAQVNALMPLAFFFMDQGELDARYVFGLDVLRGLIERERAVWRTLEREMAQRANRPGTAQRSTTLAVALAMLVAGRLFTHDVDRPVVTPSSRYRRILTILFKSLGEQSSVEWAARKGLAEYRNSRAWEHLPERHRLPNQTRRQQHQRLRAAMISASRREK